MKRNIIIAVNIVLMAAYFSPALFFFLKITYVAQRFKKVEIEEIVVLQRFSDKKAESYSRELNGYNLLLRQNEATKELEIVIDGTVINTQAVDMWRNKFITPSQNILNVDSDSYRELYLFYHESPDNLLDFYEEDGEIKYKMTSLERNSFIGKHIDSYKSDFFVESISIAAILYVGTILLISHLVLLLLIFIVWKVVKQIKSKKKI